MATLFLRPVCEDSVRTPRPLRVSSPFQTRPSGCLGKNFAGEQPKIFLVDSALEIAEIKFLSEILAYLEVRGRGQECLA